MVIDLTCGIMITINCSRYKTFSYIRRKSGRTDNAKENYLYCANNTTRSIMAKKQTLIQKYSYLIGQKINRWTILEITHPGKQAYATCQCECGTIKSVRVLNILYGYSKDCGCGRKKLLREKETKNLVGQRFGKLTVTELLEESNKFKRRQYKCKCDCGNEIITSSICLISGHTKSCGCLLSYHNMYIDQFLTKNQINHISEYPVIIDNIRYRYDFYLPEYNLFIEYDGEQHYIPPKYCGDNIEANQKILEKTQQHDKIKNQYCEENNIELLRIPYWEQKNIDTIINSCLQRLSEKDSVA